MMHYLEDFLSSPAPLIIGILSLVVAIGIATMQTLNKIKKYKEENEMKTLS